MTFSLKRQFSAEVSLTGIFPHLKYGGTIGCSPRVQEIVFASGDKPLAGVCKLEGEDAGVVEVELVLLLVVDVKHFHIAALHPAMDTQQGTEHSFLNQYIIVKFLVSESSPPSRLNAGILFL